MNLKRPLKKLLLPRGRTVRTIRSGLLAGLKMELDFESNVQEWLGLYEREIHGWFRTLSRGIATAIDVGAHRGMYTLYFLARTPAKKVMPFELLADNLLSLRRNLELNKLADESRVEIIPKYVGSVASHEPAVKAGDWVILDSFLQRITPPCLVKVDIDGRESELLEGARQCLALPEMRWIIETHSFELEKKCVETLRAAGYSTVIVDHAWWRSLVPELRPEANRWLIATPGDAFRGPR